MFKGIETTDKIGFKIRKRMYSKKPPTTKLVSPPVTLTPGRIALVAQRARLYMAVFLATAFIV